MNRRAAPAYGLVLALFAADACADPDVDPLHEAELREQADIARLRAINAGELEFLTEAAATQELHTRMVLTLSEASLRDGWVDMQQCQSGLDGMQLTEVVYRYADMRALRIVSSRGIGQAWAEDQSVQLRAVEPDAEVCVAAEVKILRALGDGRYRIVSGPYHRRFFDGFFPLRLSLEVTFPEDMLHWHSVSPTPQSGFAVHTDPGRLAIETRFAGMLTVEVDFVQPGYRTPQPPSPQ